jgi:excinuclease ABC subunit A
LTDDTLREGDLDIDQVGADVAMPWRVDGKRWHTEQRLSHQGKPCVWEGEVLARVEEAIQKTGQFSLTNWKHPSTVEITGPVKSAGWFFHAHTNMEWLVRLVFRVSKNTFKQIALEKALAIPPLNETEGVRVYSNDPRVRVANRRGPWQEVWMLVHRMSEIDTPAFRDFLTKAIASFHKNITKMKTRPEDVMPWKIAGEKWHLGDKGFPPGKKIAWDRALLSKFLALAQEVEPKLTVTWDNRAHIVARVPGITSAWLAARTKLVDVLEIRLFGEKSRFNLDQLHKFGQEPNITTSRGGDVIRLQFEQSHHFPVVALREFLREHLAGFRAWAGK